MSRPGKGQDDGHGGGREPQETDPEAFYPPRPRLTPTASLALPVLLGLALWGFIFLLVG